MFDKEKEYYFLGKVELIEQEKKEEETEEKEKEKEKEKNNDTENIYLGKFIEYIPTFYVKDLLMNGKARFEYGIISCGNYKYCK